jgi:hypothetical protein
LQASPILERKLETITSGLGQAFLTALQTISYDNSSTIADYILAMRTESYDNSSTIADYILAMRTETNLSNLSSGNLFKALLRIGPWTRTIMPLNTEKNS